MSRGRCGRPGIRIQAVEPKPRAMPPPGRTRQQRLATESVWREARRKSFDRVGAVPAPRRSTPRARTQIQPLQILVGDFSNAKFIREIRRGAYRPAMLMNRPQPALRPAQESQRRHHHQRNSREQAARTTRRSIPYRGTAAASSPHILWLQVDALNDRRGCSPADSRASASRPSDRPLSPTCIAETRCLRRRGMMREVFHRPPSLLEFSGTAGVAHSFSAFSTSRSVGTRGCSNRASPSACRHVTRNRASAFCRMFDCRVAYSAMRSARNGG